MPDPRSQTAPSPLGFARQAVADAAPPLAAALVFAAALFGSGAPELVLANRLHLLALLAALAACLPAGLRLPRFSIAGALALLCGSLPLLWIVPGYLGGEAPDAAFPWLVLAVDAALLFYVGAQAARRRPALFLLLALGAPAALILGKILGGGLSRLSPADSVYLAAAAIASGAALLHALAPWLNRSGAHLALLLLLLWTGGVWAARVETARRTDSPAAFFHREEGAGRSLPAQLGRDTLRGRPLEGLGPGAFERRLRGYGTSTRSETIPVPPAEFFPEGPRDFLLRQSAPAAPLPDGPAPNPLPAFLVLAVENGVIGIGLLLAAFLLLVLSSLRALLAGGLPRPVLAAGALLVLVGAVAEGGLGPVLHQPAGILLCAALAGLLWRLAHPETAEGAVEREETGGLDAAEQASWKSRCRALVLRPRFWGPLAAAGLLALPTLLPLRGQHLIERARAERPGSPRRLELLQAAVGAVPFSARAQLLLAEELRTARPGEAGYSEAFFHFQAALANDPWSEETCAALARFHLENRETARALEILEAGSARCPASALLAAWQADFAKRSGDTVREALALGAAARLSTGARRLLRPWFLGEAAALLEKGGDGADALEAWCQRFQCLPGDEKAAWAIRRLAVVAADPPSAFQLPESAAR